MNQNLTGKLVRLSEGYKHQLLNTPFWELIKEFQYSFGIVEGLVDYGEFKGPEVDVLWIPSYLRYGYHPNNLQVFHNRKEDVSFVLVIALELSWERARQIFFRMRELGLEDVFIYKPDKGGDIYNSGYANYQIIWGKSEI